MRWSCSWQAFALGAIVFVIWIARWPGGPAAMRSGHASTSGVSGIGRTAWLVARVIGSIVTVPFAEELAFRGFLTRRLISADFEAVPPGRFTPASFLLSSIAFGVLHDRWLEGTIAAPGCSTPSPITGAARSATP
jgi:CAAX prenyl protease-like protein